MGPSPTTSASRRAQRSASDGVAISDVEDEVKLFLDALSDADCRRILDVMSADALTANEISEACDMPLSTTYRKVDTLADTGLVEEKIRFNQSGRYISEYSRSIDKIDISISDGETIDHLILDLFD